MPTWSNMTHFRLKSIALKRKGAEPENQIEALLKPIKNLTVEVDACSDVSEISDVFEEFHRNSYLRRHYLTKHEADVKTMEEFTDDFKRTMITIRNDSKMGENLLLESEDDVNAIFNTAKDPDIFPKTHEKMVQILEDDAYCTPTLQQLNEMRKDSDTSSVSMTWHMLEVQSDGKKFAVTPPGYDAFRQDKPHWLQRASVSWSDIDQSNVKCEHWLEEHCQ